MPLVEAARRRITAEHERHELGTLAVFYKTAAEMLMLAQDYVTGEALCDEALRCFRLVDDFDCSGLIEGCQMLQQIAASNKPRTPPPSEGGAVTRDAFCLVMLVRTEKLSAEDLQRCQAAFDALDEDGSGTLDMADVHAARQREEEARHASGAV